MSFKIKAGGEIIKALPHLFENNREWSSKICASNPEFFSKLVAHIRDIHRWHQAKLEVISGVSERMQVLSELNVVEQVINVGNTTIIQDAWGRGHKIPIHGWIYDIVDGLLKDLDVSVTSRKELDILQKS